VKIKFVNFLLVPILVGSLFTLTSSANTVASGAVTPGVTIAGGKVMIHSAVSNLTQTNQAVTVTLTVTNPGTCITGHLPTHAGAFAFSLRRNETRLADLSLDVPPSACSGTYGVSVTVKNSSGMVLATHSSKFTVTIPGP
jgi:hypothetical protein